MIGELSIIALIVRRRYLSIEERSEVLGYIFKTIIKNNIMTNR
ncbi:hypothetical protein Bint_2202 [Brachyspira intermedia PWS/A]|uniref:Uncharacterized protein n=1 Tax=Brachyspira intermedia (strain ATCC 51140 / PWS/A) TaxID=1045858 RepID=G0ELW1_BRAIP|nr:hypothetical protein Bint_2202 [Brachyspira intermedia PWS/A]